MTTLDTSMEYMYHSDGRVEFWVTRDGISGSKLIKLAEDYTPEDLESAIEAAIAAENI